MAASSIGGLNDQVNVISLRAGCDGLMGRAANAYCLAPKCILGLAMIILLVAGTPAEGLLTQSSPGPGLPRSGASAIVTAA